LLKGYGSEIAQFRAQDSKSGQLVNGQFCSG